MKRGQPIPKDSAGFFRARARNPTAFQFTPEGNLRVPVIRDEPESVIEIPFYRPLTVDELAEADATRKSDIQEIEEQIDALTLELQEAIQAYREIGIVTEVIRLQRELARMETMRSAKVSPLRWIKDIKNPVTRLIFPDMPYEVRHLGYDVHQYTTRPHTNETMIREGKAEEAEPVDDGAIGGEGEEEEEIKYTMIYLPDDEETGYLSPEFAIEFVYNSVKYTSVLQAYEIERAMMLGRKDVKPLLMKTRAVKTIRTVAAGIKGEIENPQKLWEEVYGAMLSQHQEFAERLVKTGTDRLVYANPLDGKAGIGLPPEDPLALTKANWKGQNLLGLALESVRAKLKEDRAAAGSSVAEAAAGGGAGGSSVAEARAYTEHARTQEEENKLVGGIIAARRR
jgi:predicted NAD-dependent protein-ADP-ribosyltransferase YbiA (DUF1768 family)